MSARLRGDGCYVPLEQSERCGDWRLDRELVTGTRVWSRRSKRRAGVREFWFDAGTGLPPTASGQALARAVKERKTGVRQPAR